MFLSLSSFAQSRYVQQDTASAVEVRKPLKINELRKSTDYYYGQTLLPEENWFARMWQRFINWLFRDFNGGKIGAGWSFFWKYIFAPLILLLVILKLMGVEFSDVFTNRTPTINIPYEAYGEDIHAINYQEAIEEAIQKRNYRLAIRLYYLKTLKELADRELINWQINKTNRAYVYELKNQELQRGFDQLTTQFEYAWYGEFPINEDQFGQIKTDFQYFGQRL
jgi:hypothetical protein